MASTLALHPRHRLDLRVVDLAHGVLSLGVRRARTGTVLARAGVPDEGLVTASVRSGWLLLLEAVGWPPGSEVLVSAVTHPEMPALAVAAGLVPVPVEVDLDTLLPPVDALAAALTPRTRAVLVAQLFGGRADLGSLGRWCTERDLLLVEDAAQAWTGAGSLRSAADVTLVSFGLLKTATAVGGAVLRVGDPALRAAMVSTASGWPLQARRAYAVRLLRAALLLGLARRPVYGVLLAACRRLGRDPRRRARRPVPAPCHRRSRPAAAPPAVRAAGRPAGASPPQRRPVGRPPPRAGVGGGAAP